MHEKPGVRDHPQYFFKMDWTDKYDYKGNKKLPIPRCIVCDAAILTTEGGLCFKHGLEAGKCYCRGFPNQHEEPEHLLWTGDIRWTFFTCALHTPQYFCNEDGAPRENIDWKLIGAKISGQWLKVTEGKYKMASGQWLQKWDVVGSTGETYVVSRKQDGTFGCSCPGWKFKKAPKPDCKHIKAMKKAYVPGFTPARVEQENREFIDVQRFSACKHDAGFTNLRCNKCGQILDRILGREKAFYRPLQPKTKEDGVVTRYTFSNPEDMVEKKKDMVEKKKTDVDGESFFVSGRKFRD